MVHNLYACFAVLHTDRSQSQDFSMCKAGGRIDCWGIDSVTVCGSPKGLCLKTANKFCIQANQ